MKYYVVKYQGQFGYIKPWTAVRDSETFSQQFLTPSIIEGIEKKLFPELLNEKGIHKILRHRLSYQLIDMQQEKTWSKGGFLANKEKEVWKTNLGIINRGVMINPMLFLAFAELIDAEKALEQTICLIRNEDLAFPINLFEIDESSFDEINGFELHFQDLTNKENGFLVGYNRFNESEKMYGELKIYGNPVGVNNEGY